MPEQFLHDAHIGAALEQVRRERVAQGVQRDVAIDAGRTAAARTMRSQLGETDDHLVG